MSMAMRRVDVERLAGVDLVNWIEERLPGMRQDVESCVIQNKITWYSFLEMDTALWVDRLHMPLGIAISLAKLAKTVREDVQSLSQELPQQSHVVQLQVNSSACMQQLLNFSCSHFPRCLLAMERSLLSQTAQDAMQMYQGQSQPRLP